MDPTDDRMIALLARIADDVNTIRFIVKTVFVVVVAAAVLGLFALVLLLA